MNKELIFKNDMSQEEWNVLKQNIKEYFIYE